MIGDGHVVPIYVPGTERDMVAITFTAASGSIGTVAYVTCGWPDCRTFLHVLAQPRQTWPGEVRRRGWTNSGGLATWFCPAHTV